MTQPNIPKGKTTQEAHILRFENGTYKRNTLNRHEAHRLQIYFSGLCGMIYIGTNETDILHLSYLKLNYLMHRDLNSYAQHASLSCYCLLRYQDLKEDQHGNLLSCYKEMHLGLGL